MAYEQSGRLPVADHGSESAQALSSDSIDGAPIATLGGRKLLPNTGMPLDIAWLDRVRGSISEVEHSAQSFRQSSTGKEPHTALLLQVIRCMDLTTLSEDDTDDRVKRLCAKARQPLQPDLLKCLGIDEVKVAAVCIYRQFVELALRALEGSGIHVATVSAGFPNGLGSLAERLAEIRNSVSVGAEEIDVVIRRSLVLEEKWQELYDEVVQFRAACNGLQMKVILGTGDLRSLLDVTKASLVAMMAGADFIKTSTGKERINATLPVSLVMVRAIRDYAEQTGMAVGFKPAGGIRTARQSLEYLSLMEQELGGSWMKPDLFRFGASTLLDDIGQQLANIA